MVAVKRIVLLALLVACWREPAEPAAARTDEGKPEASAKMKSTSQLTIVVDARWVSDTGYSHVWDAEVRRVIDGTLPDRVVQLHLIDGSGKSYGGRFDSAQETSVTLRLRKLPELPPGLEGFVAADHTIWALVAVDPK